MNRHGLTLPLLALLPIAAAAVALAPRPAHACGGTFCQAGPQAMPVDQTGENIMFVMGEGTVEAHIQIQYTGDPEEFAWVVPVMAVPDVEVGSQALFTNMLQASVPTYQLARTNLGCGVDGGGGIGCGSGIELESLAGGGETGDDGFGDPEDDEDSPDVVKRGFAGAFEYVVLEGGTVQGVVDWLDMAGFAQDEDAPPILQEYLDEGFVFLAIKLRSGAGVDEIHPVVVRYEGDEPCVPIRLTRIAAADDMGIRAFFLGDARVVPKNYDHVVLNDVKIDWVTTVGGNYLEAVTLAVDEAGGRAFVTEYAGQHAVSRSGVDSWTWDATAFADIAPIDVVDELQEQGLALCTQETCVTSHAQVPGLLAEFLPVPGGVDPDAFYACLSCYEQDIDLLAWDAAEFAAAFDERIAVPGEHAAGLLDANPYLTRLFTTLSPHEMMEDPLFHENAGLPSIDNVVDADRKFACEGPDWIEFENGTYLALDDANGNAQPEFEDMPWALRIETTPAQGAPMVQTDNTEAIGKILDAWNRDHPLIVEEDSEDQLPEEASTPDDGAGACACSDRERRDRDGALHLLAIFALAAVGRRRRRGA